MAKIIRVSSEHIDELQAENAILRRQLAELRRALEAIENWADDGATRAEGLILACGTGLRTASGVFRAIRSKARAIQAKVDYHESL